MFIQTEETPNPNSLKFVPNKMVSEIGPVEIFKKDIDNQNATNTNMRNNKFITKH